VMNLLMVFVKLFKEVFWIFLVINEGARVLEG
jgi:hypothetical protein